MTKPKKYVFFIVVWALLSIILISSAAVCMNHMEKEYEIWGSVTVLAATLMCLFANELLYQHWRAYYKREKNKWDKKDFYT